MKVIDAINMEYYTKQPYGKIIVSNNQLVIIFWNNFTDVIALVIFYISIY